MEIFNIQGAGLGPGRSERDLHVRISQSYVKAHIKVEKKRVL